MSQCYNCARQAGRALGTLAEGHDSGLQMLRKEMVMDDKNGGLEVAGWVTLTTFRMC
jgi:hypothetical protein